MPTVKPSNVNAAFEMLLEEVEAQVAVLNQLGGAAFAEGKHERAAELLRRAQTVTAFRGKVDALRSEWEALGPSGVPRRRGRATRLARGLRTPEEAYFRAILQALIDLGGSGRMGDVLGRVHEAMKDTLRKVDYEAMPSDPETPRWRNTAQWARMALVEQGLMKKGSQRGVWEISEEGRAALKRASA